MSVVLSQNKYWLLDSLGAVMDKTPGSSFTEKADNGDSYGKGVSIKHTQLILEQKMSC